jgi:hypothetical protein
MAYETSGHMLKHKRSYAPEALTPKEAQDPWRASRGASVWLKTGKKVYQAITRGLFNFPDARRRQRLVNDAPVLTELIGRTPPVRDTAIVVLCRPPLRRRALCVCRATRFRWRSSSTTSLPAAKGASRPEHIQVVHSAARGCRRASRVPKSCSSSR